MAIGDQMPIDFARAQRDDGMKRALDHAESDEPNWGELAYAYLKRYAETHDRFPGWYVTNEAELSGSLAPPPTRKAWGSIFTKAQRAGLIVKEGYRQDPNRHANPCPLWRSLVFKP